MTNENGNTAANGETKIPESPVVNENATNEMVNENLTTNKKTKTDETENQSAAVNENASRRKTGHRET